MTNLQSHPHGPKAHPFFQPRVAPGDCRLFLASPFDNLRQEKGTVPLMSAPRRYNGRYNGSGAAEEAVQRKLPGVA
jgi:hypothetical protein